MEKVAQWGSIIICTHHQILLGRTNQEERGGFDIMARMGEEKNVYKVLVGKQRKGMMVLEWILERQAGVCGMGSPGSGKGPVVGSCECSAEPSSSGTMELEGI
jgi:hypothetical protein